MLCGLLDTEATDDLLRQVSGECRGGDWSSILEHGAAGAGLRVRWSQLTIWDASRESHRDAPWVTWVDDGPSSGWWLIERARPTRTLIRRIGGVEGERWLTHNQLTSLLGDGLRLVARVEPALPASPLGPGPGGRPRSPMRRLLGLLRAEQDAIATVVVFAFTVGILALAPPLAIQVIINWLAFGVLLQPIIAVAFVLVLCMLAAAALRSSQRHLVEIIQRRVFVRTVADLTARLVRVRIRALDRHYGPELVNRFFDILTVQKATNTLLLYGLSAALQALVGLVLLAFYHPVLLAFDVAVIALLLLLIPLGRGAEKTAIKESKAKYKIAGWIEEIARHPHAFKLGGGRLGEERAESLMRDYLDARESHFRVFFRQYVGLQLIQVAIPGALLLLCGWLVLEGQLTLGQLVAAEFIITSALAGMSKFTDKLETVYDLLAGIDKLGTLIDLPHEVSTGLAGSPPPGAASLKLIGVRYGYEGRPFLPWSLDAEIPADARVLITGAPASGKTTLADILSGLRAPSTGQLLRDGMLLSLLRPDVAHAEVELVRQDGLFEGTVRDNLLAGRAGLDVGVAWAVLEQLSLSACITALPDGLETRLAPSGAPLSGQQSRALLLARALSGHPRLLIIDGLLDGLSPEIRNDLMVGICAAEDTTVVIFSAETLLSPFATHTYELNADGLHARPVIRSA